MRLFPVGKDGEDEKVTIVFRKEANGDLTVRIEKVPRDKFSLVQDYTTEVLTVRVAPNGTEDRPHRDKESSLLRKFKENMKKLLQK